jgi:hypothetical protein
MLTFGLYFIAFVFVFNINDHLLQLLDFDLKNPVVDFSAAIMQGKKASLIIGGTLFILTKNLLVI